MVSRFPVLAGFVLGSDRHSSTGLFKVAPRWTSLPGHLGEAQFAVSIQVKHPQLLGTERGDRVICLTSSHQGLQLPFFPLGSLEARDQQGPSQSLGETVRIKYQLSLPFWGC